MSSDDFDKEIERILEYLREVSKRVIKENKEDIATIQNLPKGKFLMHCGTSTSIEDVPYFESPIQPQQYVEPQKPKKPNLIQRIIRAVIGE